MDLRYFLFVILLFFIFQIEGFVNIYNHNQNYDHRFPDNTQFFPVANHENITMKEFSGKSLGNNNYQLVRNSIREPQSGVYSAFLDTKKLRNFDHFFHSPITDKEYSSDLNFKRHYEYEIIQEEDINKTELLEKERINDNLIHNPHFLHGHHQNNSPILYSKNIQDLLLKHKKRTNRYENVSHTGKGYHGL